MNTYQTDFYAWIEEQTSLLRQGQVNRLDVEHLIEELESMSARERRELINRLTILLNHLLKWRYQPERRCNSWRFTINEQRRQLVLLLEDSPGLAMRLPEFLQRSYRNAKRAALEETGLLNSPFPESSPYTTSEILDEDFWPDETVG